MINPPNRTLLRVFSAIFLLGIWIGLSFASYSLLAVQRGQRFDFFPHWTGARSIMDGNNPYTHAVTLRIQEGMFGQQLPAGTDEFRFVYSPLIAWLLLPFWLLPFPIAVSLWCGLQLLLVLILPIWVASLLKWRIQPLNLILIMIFSTLIFRYTIIAYVIGQYTAFSLACLIAAWYGIARKKPAMAALALVLATVRTEIVALPILFLFYAAWRSGLRRTIVIWVAGIGGLWLLTHFWIGAWELNYLEWLMSYRSYATPVWPPGLLNSTPLAVLVLLGLIIWGWWFYKAVASLELTERTGWGLSASILIWLIVFPQTGNYTLILALLPAWMTLWATRRKKIFWLAVFAVLSSPWLLYAFNPGSTDSEHLLVPIALGILLTIGWLTEIKAGLPAYRKPENDPEYSITQA